MSIFETLQRMRRNLQEEAASLRVRDASDGDRDRIRLLELSVSETERALVELARRTEAAQSAHEVEAAQEPRWPLLAENAKRS